MSGTSTILIADDSAAQRKLLELTLKDYTVLVAEDGAEALGYLETHTPELIVLDVDMPFATGVEVCERVKQDPAHEHVPVIIVTSMRDERTRQAAQEAGATLFLNKPLARGPFLEEVARLLTPA